MKPAMGRQAGFTLIEVVVAFAIAALGISLIYQIYGTGLRSTALAGEYTQAAMLAEAQLSRMGLEERLSEGEEAGDFDNGYTWFSRVEAYEALDGEELPGAEEASEVASAELFRLTVTVAWGQPSRSVSVETIRVAEKRP